MHFNIAVRLPQEVLNAQEKLIDDLETEFHDKLRRFSNDVKTAMRAASRQVALETFELALVFLTQIFPDVTSAGASSSSEQDDEASKSWEEKFEGLSKRFTDLETEMQNGVSEILNDVKDLSNRLDVLDQLGVENVATKLNDLETKLQDESAKRVDMEEKLKANLSKAAETPARSGSNQASASDVPATASLGPIQSLRQRSTFSMTAENIQSIKLLPGGLIVLADWEGDVVKLFNSSGDFIHSCSAEPGPNHLAVLDITATSGWDVAVTLYRAPRIDVIHVTPQDLTLKTSIPTTKPYDAIAAVDSTTLAVGYARYGIDLINMSGQVLRQLSKTSIPTTKPYDAIAPVGSTTLAVGCARYGIELINLSGQVLRQLSSTLNPWYMAASPDKHLLVSNSNGLLLKLKLADCTLVFKENLDNLTNPRDIACHHQDSSCIVADSYTRTLHLVSAGGAWVKELWAHPDGTDEKGSWVAVSVLGDQCVCCTKDGQVIVFDILY
ncbi:hypothetical protein ElyMa_005511700 [Elysia marginata]|uniref:B-box C-terminal domain-containing protein n=1 Tax=Elysia marginata TaxID=1093978 RepID=A0AAV4EUK1_9GAST|nr:hypothetical protein ElyMa_005511700 [Elysia marginata]